ncbi:AraC family transcriptional regulator [Allohahella sp. A8]|uniref:AraC family transcriptional regulator n=1 Tax=Allohahella sp. A8 TaxID=3141461 RepID=UPI003A7FB5EA
MTRTSQWPLPPGSTRYMVPGPVAQELARHPLTRDLYPLAFGHYRHAAGHHMHRQQHSDNLLIYCSDGQAWLNVEGEPLTVTPGDLLLLPRGASHRYTADPGHPWTVHWVHFGGELADLFCDQLGFGGKWIRHVGQQSRLLVDFNGLLAVQHTGYRLARLIHASNRLRQLLTAIPLSSDIEASKPALAIDDIHGYMREHLDERLTLAQLAEIAGLSEAHFATRYKALTGESPIQHFLHLKIEQACQLLDTTSLSFRAISSALGYDDSYYFSRLFKKIMGHSPTAYRQMHRHQA